MLTEGGPKLAADDPPVLPKLKSPALAVEEVVVGALAAAEGFVPNPKTEDCADDVVVF